MNPYRIPAPPDPPPSWWERHRGLFYNIAAGAAVLAGSMLYVQCMCAIESCNEAHRVKLIQQFEERVAECPIVEVDRGKREDPVMATLQCPTYRERRQVPPGARLP